MILRPLAALPGELNLKALADLVRPERVRVGIEVIRLLREQSGHRTAIGAWVAGPFTLALQ